MIRRRLSTCEIHDRASHSYSSENRILDTGFALVVSGVLEGLLALSLQKLTASPLVGSDQDWVPD